MEIVESIEITYNCNACNCLVPAVKTDAESETVVICSCGNVVGVL